MPKRRHILLFHARNLAETVGKGTFCFSREKRGERGKTYFSMRETWLKRASYDGKVECPLFPLDGKVECPLFAELHPFFTIHIPYQ
jgi:hypothetical protein